MRQQGWQDISPGMTKATLFAAFAALLAAPVAAAPPAEAPGQPAAKAAPQFISRDDVTKRFEARFTQMDKDRSGSLDRGEIDAARATFVGLTKSVINGQVRQEFAATDTNKDGQASLAEMTAAAPAEARAGVAAVLAELDTNKDKKLSLAEFGAAAPAPEVGGTNEFLGRFDADKDGKVTAAEYRGPGLAAFDQIDANKDGKVTPAEKKAAQPKG